MTKRILITGKSSYIGNKFVEWINYCEEDFELDQISVRDEKWKEMDFSVYDSILHLAGIAHVSKDPKMEDLYYAVNRDLTINLAKKAREDGVKQFIFMSSIIVYGDGVGKDGLIDEQTVPKPRDFYGNSKLQAEEGIIPLNDDSFKVAIIRPPMIYGIGSKGNYPRLAKLAEKTPIFPDFENKRSMLHIDNLTEFIAKIISNQENGFFFPQNREYVCTSKLVKEISEIHNKKLILFKVINPLINFTSNKNTSINKLFGNLYYEESMSNYVVDYRVRDFKSSIKYTENNK